ncbi:hypothetical protein [Aquimarina agarilytica]|uniref:hypothetical protein n=1 Tax=Aquimarina agarilytica TaxID=1087449 RepID=UPI000289E50A|nr:hypothetical protein [Aquimarina agarilytica]
MNPNHIAPTPKMHLDFGTVFKNTKQYIDQYNKKQPKLTDRLNANHRATAELIIRLYAKQINKSAIEISIAERLPGLKTYNPSLASCKGCTVRTIINHKQRLLQSGFLIEDIHRGADGVELKINPVVLNKLKISTQVDDKTQQITPLASFFKGRVKNLHPLVHVQQEHLNNNSPVDKLITPQQPEKKEKEVFVSSATGTPQEHDKNKEESAIFTPKDQTKVNGVERAFLLQLVRQFWGYSKKSLYPSQVFTEAENTEILNHIWRSVFQRFKLEGNKKQWENYQEMLLKRMDMVARWLKRNPKHWIPAPHLYFNENNIKNGFDKTWSWYVKQEHQKKEIRNQLLIQAVDHEWKQHKKGQGKHKFKTRFELYRLQCKRLSKYKDKQLLNAYEQCLHRNLFTL